uniref:Uncharacterized protein n=1 Tax=Trachysalambria curvirostris majanivirus TaxID=2984281 RepID=A0A9C7F8A2_9VIRU|nr:MAG: hypothetical protein [Trachysalambria curvirostris majanivirus]
MDKQLEKEEQSDNITTEDIIKDENINQIKKRKRNLKQDGNDDETINKKRRIIQTKNEIGKIRLKKYRGVSGNDTWHILDNGKSDKKEIKYHPLSYKDKTLDFITNKDIKKYINDDLIKDSVRNKKYCKYIKRIDERNIDKEIVKNIESIKTIFSKYFLERLTIICLNDHKEEFYEICNKKDNIDNNSPIVMEIIKLKNDLKEEIRKKVDYRLNKNNFRVKLFSFFSNISKEEIKNDIVEVIYKYLVYSKCSKHIQLIFNNIDKNKLTKT